jgi:dTDP-4-amino-4,6-dideoxygalactose transaminase
VAFRMAAHVDRMGSVPWSAMPIIPFNRPRLQGVEHDYIDEALASGKLSGNGRFGQRCARDLEERLGAPRALITPSCTAALEMAAILCDLRPGDEVIMPSFTFVSTANAFALRGAIPVFVDIRSDTLNIDPDMIEIAVTERTRALVVVHYGGVACDMDRIMAIANRYGLMVVEDAAHSLPGMWHDRQLGAIGHLATFSFHETKNVHCGEGGALVVNEANLVARAEIVQEKGTNRAQFFRGDIDKYTWQDVGSSYLLSEVAAAFLWAQLEHLDDVTAERRAIWASYHDALGDLELSGLVRRPIVPSDCAHSGHLYYLLLPEPDLRDGFIDALRARGVQAVFHYVPLHSSPAGLKLGRAADRLPVTEDASARLVRLPMWSGLGRYRLNRVVNAVHEAIATVDAAPVASV